MSAVYNKKVRVLKPNPETHPNIPGDIQRDDLLLVSIGAYLANKTQKTSQTQHESRT